MKKKRKKEKKKISVKRSPVVRKESSLISIFHSNISDVM